MRYQLDNGLTVIVDRQGFSPVVALQVWVKAGSADETPEEAGLAHLHEHMLFKGTARRGLGEIARDVEARGGEINAWTSFDQTVYHVVLASSFLADGLDILADAVRNSAFDAGELAREIEVVVEEIKRSQDLPSRKVSRAMFETAFQAHPYRLPVLGTERSVRSFTREKVLEFFARHYAPDNMVLVIVGDVDEATTRREVERCFGGDWGRRRSAQPARAVEPSQDAPRVALLVDAVKEAQFAIAFQIPGLLSPDLPALDALAVVLGQGEGSRLNLALKLERALASEVYSYAYTPRDPGLMVAGASLDPARVRDALSLTLSEIKRLAEHRIDEAELAVAKSMIEADSVYARETVQGIARKHGFYEAVAGRLEFEEEYYARVAALSPDDLAAAASRYLSPRRMTVAAIVPESAALSSGEVASLVEGAWREATSRRPARPARGISEAPQSARRPAARRTSVSGIERAVLPSGAVVLVKPERGVPLVAMRAVYPGGLRYETDANNGISQLYGRLMARATRRRPAAVLAADVDDMAASLHGSAGRNSVSLRGELLARHFDRGLRLFIECLDEPSFAAEELEKERGVLLQDIRSRDDNPSGAAFDLFARTLFGVHPYRLDALGEEGPVKGLGEADLEALRRSEMHRSNLTLCVVGDVDPDQTFALCEELLSEPEPSPLPAPRVAQEPEPSGPRRRFRALEKAQAHLVYGFPGVTVRSPERHALDVLSSILSGQGGRLFLELRDRRSLAYSVSSFSVEGIDPGYFGVYMGTSPEKVAGALAGIREELEKLRQSPLPADEIERAKSYLVGAHAIGLQKNGARAALIGYDDAYGVGADSFLRYEQEIRSVTAERILEAARRFLDPRRGALAILGAPAADVDFDAP